MSTPESQNSYPDSSLIERLSQEAWDRAIAVEYIEVTSLDAPVRPPIKNVQAKFLAAYAELVADECAKLCETLKDSRDFPEGWGPVSEACAAAIRAKFALDSRQPSPSPTTD